MSWAWIFVLNAMMAIGVIALIVLRAKSSHDKSRRRWHTAILVVVTLAALAQLVEIGGILS